MRAFLALRLPEAARAALLESSASLRAAWPELSWASASTYHVTLAFLGEQGPAGVACAKAALASLQGATAPVLLPLRLSCFPPRGPWRVLVLEMGVSNTLIRLNDELNLRLQAEAEKAGLAPLNEEWSNDPHRPSRPFNPHISLARRGEGRGSIPDRLDPSLLSRAFEDFVAKCPEGDWPLEACVLYKSELRPKGSIYTELDRAGLLRL